MAGTGSMVTAEQIALAIGRTWGIGTERHTLALRLAERRFTHEVVSTFDIRPSDTGDGWIYPTPRGALRWKNANRGAKPKYKWVEKGKTDSLFYAFDLEASIEQAGFSVWLTTEFDVFALRSAGIYHALATLTGEGSSLPADLVELLQHMGVLTCYLAPDRDKPGMKWAQNVTDLLVPHGIEVVTRDLPADMQDDHGYDIGQAWQEYTGRRPFERWLLDLPATRLSVTQRAPRRKEMVNAPNDDMKGAIAQALGVDRFNSKGYSQPLHCPFHDDRTPSAGLHKEYGLHCFTEGRWYRWHELAEQLGMGWETSTEPQLSRLSLGDELTQVMIKAGFSVLAFTLEAAYRAGWNVGQPFTRKMLLQIVGPYRARRAIIQMQGRGGDLRKENAHGKRGRRAEQLCWELATSLFILEEALILDTNSRRGPKNRLYKLPSPLEVARVFGVKSTHYSDIRQYGAGEQPLSMADWRAEVYAIPIDRDPGSYPRSALCKPLGIARQTAATYDRRAGVRVTPKKDRRTIGTADTLPETPDIRAAWLETDDGRTFAATKSGYGRAQAHGRGGRIWLCRQLANDYER